MGMAVFRLKLHLAGRIDKYIQLEEGDCRVGLKKVPKCGVEPIGKATQCVDLDQLPPPHVSHSASITFLLSNTDYIAISFSWY